MHSGLDLEAVAKRVSALEEAGRIVRSRPAADCFPCHPCDPVEHDHGKNVIKALSKLAEQNARLEELTAFVRQKLGMVLRPEPSQPECDGADKVTIRRESDLALELFSMSDRMSANIDSLYDLMHRVDV